MLLFCLTLLHYYFRIFLCSTGSVEKRTIPPGYIDALKSKLANLEKRVNINTHFNKHYPVQNSFKIE